MVNKEVQEYNHSQSTTDQAICDVLSNIISENLPEAEHKIWHGHPVWFIEGNPVAGYSKLKGNVRLLFWSGQSFDEPLLVQEGKFKAAEIRYTDVNQVNEADLLRWLEKARNIQWDYKNIVKRKGVLVRLQ